MRFATLICDVGRDKIPPEILNKRGPLTHEEWVEIAASRSWAPPC